MTSLTGGHKLGKGIGPGEFRRTEPTIPRPSSEQQKNREGKRGEGEGLRGGERGKRKHSASTYKESCRL